MKLRVQGNSIRLRLKQDEVATLAQGGAVEVRLSFGPDADTHCLLYRLECTELSTIQVAYRAHCVTIQLPKADATGWTESEEVGFEHTVPLEGGGSMHILIEKDFRCTDIRPDENDCYPNPNVSC